MIMPDVLMDVYFPYEIQLALDGLCNKTRRQILSILLTNDELSFSEIEKLISIESSLLSNHLKILIKNLLVEQFYEHNIKKNKYSFYRISYFGKKFIEALNEVMNPIKDESFRIVRLNVEILEGKNTSSIAQYQDFLEGMKKKQEFPTTTSEQVPIIKFIKNKWWLK